MPDEEKIETTCDILKKIYKEPEYTNHIVGIIDILGFKDFIIEQENNANFKGILDILNDIRSHISEKRRVVGSLSQTKISIVSDTIIFSLEYEKFYDYDLSHNPFDIPWIIQSVAEFLLQKKMLFRGVVNYGLLYHNTNNDIIVGSALNECFEHEKHIAIYPRIIATNKFYNKIKRIKSAAFYNKITGGDNLLYRDLLYQDFDGIFCFNWIESLIADYRMRSDLRSLKKQIAFISKLKNNSPRINMKIEYLKKMLEMAFNRLDKI